MRQEKVPQGEKSQDDFWPFQDKSHAPARRRGCGLLRTLRWQKDSVEYAYSRTQECDETCKMTRNKADFRAN
jgi:hypothetical protein